MPAPRSATPKSQQRPGALTEAASKILQKAVLVDGDGGHLAVAAPGRPLLDRRCKVGQAMRRAAARATPCGANGRSGNFLGMKRLEAEQGHPSQVSTAAVIGAPASQRIRAPWRLDSPLKSSLTDLDESLRYVAAT